MCSGSLTERTSVIAEEVCFDKSLTNMILHRAGLRVPDQLKNSSREANVAFLEKHKRIVIKPLSQSLGRGVSVDIRTIEDVENVIKLLQITGDETFIFEEMIEGEDVRIIVIDYKFVAAVHRTPPHVTGNGKDTIQTLITKLNKTQKITGQIPLNYETERCIKLQRYSLQDILPEGIRIPVRKNTNEHTGGIPTDVTDQISPALQKIAIQTALVLNIPVVGIDFIVPEINGDEYVIIEANSRPGLDGHEPQPVADSFITFLFPENTV